jgi:hypothetical protein
MVKLIQNYFKSSATEVSCSRVSNCYGQCQPTNPQAQVVENLM